MTESMALEWEKWLEQEKANVEIVEKRIECLLANHDAPEGFAFREFWTEVREITDLIMNLNPLPEEERDKLRSACNRVCSEVKRKQDQDRRKHAQEWQVRRGQSQKQREVIEIKIAEALSIADGDGDELERLAKAQAVLSDALAMLKGKTVPDSDAAAEGEQKPQGNGLLRDDNQACWEKWRAANDSVFGRRQAIWEQHYEEVQPVVQAALDEATSGDSFLALDKVKEAQRYLKENPLSRVRREEIRAMLNTAWDTAIVKVNETRDAKRKKHEQWLDRTQGQIARWTDTQLKNKEEITEVAEQIKRIEAQIRTASSPDIAATFKDWIGQKRQRVTELTNESQALEAQITALREKLSN